MLMSRRELMKTAAAAAVVAPPDTKPSGYGVRTVTRGPRHHFFGYYGICPWNRSGKWLVCLESTSQDHLPGPDEPAGVGLVDPRTGTFQQIAQTRAWNLQQGAMLHWNPLAPEDEILYNDRQDGQLVTAVLNARSGKKRTLPRPLAGVGYKGRYALCLDYGRLARVRPVVGYVGAVDPNPKDRHPENDGVFLMDLETGRSRLVLSVDQVYRRLIDRHPEIRDRDLFFNHTVFNKDDSRFFVLARTFTPERKLETGMFTAARDGSDLREVIPYGTGVSHFDWRNTTEILATFRYNGSEMKHVLFTDGLKDYRVIGEGSLLGDGHCSFAPDQNRIVTDRNHGDTLEKSLMVYDLKAERGSVIGSFKMREPRYLNGDLRCDLHPRWSRDGRKICFDALAADGTRQLHLAAQEG